jgi:hypothetical protein
LEEWLRRIVFAFCSSGGKNHTWNLTFTKASGDAWYHEGFLDSTGRFLGPLFLE